MSVQQHHSHGKGPIRGSEHETLFYGRWRIAEITRATDVASPRAYVLAPEVRSRPELAEVAAFVDFCMAMYPDADRGHCDRLELERKTRFSKLLESSDWRLVDTSGRSSAAQCPFFFSGGKVNCFPGPTRASKRRSVPWWLQNPYYAFRVFCARCFGVSYGAPVRAWTLDESRNILSPENLRRVREALEEPHNVIFGQHCYYRAGCSPSEFVFADFATYLSVVEASKPGDYFTGYSLADIRHLAFATFGGLSSDRPIEPAGEELAKAKEILRSDVNVEVVGRKLDGDRLHCSYEGLGEHEEEEEVKETLAEWRELDGELILFRDDDLDAGDHDVAVQTANLRDRPRIHTIVDAKRPNAWGRTPISGSY